jgi:hypothetical protein
MSKKNNVKRENQHPEINMNYPPLPGKQVIKKIAKPLHKMHNKEKKGYEDATLVGINLKDGFSIISSPFASSATQPNISYGYWPLRRKK